MSVKQRGKFFHYQFMVNAVLYRGSTKQTTLGKARQFESDLMGMIVRGEAGPRPGRGKVPLLSEFAKSFLDYVDKREAASDLDRDTVRGYHNGWRLLSSTRVAGMRLDRIGRKDASVLDFPGSPYNANQALATLSVMLGYAVELGLLIAQPRIKLRKVYGRFVVIPSWLEVIMLKHASRDLRTIMTIMLDAGPRPEEVCRMRWEHVHWEHNQIHIPYGKTKNSKRAIGLTERMLLALEDMRAESVHRERRNPKYIDTPWVFPARRGLGHISNPKDAWRKMLRAVRAEVAERGLPPIPAKVVLYSCRDTFATNFLSESGGDIGQLMMLMGHASITTTQKYLHPSTSDAAEVMNRHNRNKLQIVRKRA